MNLAQLAAQMESNAEAVRSIVEAVSDEQARWRPTVDAWSMADVMAHLAYEEVHDFRDRLELILHRPDEHWPLAEPNRGVYAESNKDLSAALQEFVTARRASMVWLRKLRNPDWEAAHEAPFGCIRAGDVLASWLGHDLLHLRQLTELRWSILARQIQPYELHYAGEW